MPMAGCFFPLVTKNLSLLGTQVWLFGVLFLRRLSCRSIRFFARLCSESCQVFPSYISDFFVLLLTLQIPSFTVTGSRYPLSQGLFSSDFRSSLMRGQRRGPRGFRYKVFKAFNSGFPCVCRRVSKSSVARLLTSFSKSPFFSHRIYRQARTVWRNPNVSLAVFFAMVFLRFTSVSFLHFLRLSLKLLALICLPALTVPGELF